MPIGLVLVVVSLFAVISAFPSGVAVAACTLVAPAERRRVILGVAAAAALIAVLAGLLLPVVVVRAAAWILLALGVIGVLATVVLLLRRRDRTEVAAVAGMIVAPLVAGGHLLGSVPTIAGLLGPAPVGAASSGAATTLVPGVGLAVGAITILVLTAVPLRMRRPRSPLALGLAVGAAAAALVIGAQLVAPLLGLPAPSTTTALMVTVLGLVAGTAFRALGADRSGALAGMPHGNH